ncbi:MAG TPA: large conductance mechanosensitive channel protein MscL [Micromonosporaceae bacterium]|nr:large conductance mechanosensitive channel protein MscL [Micromonosporaceae bacterium]
MLKGFREFVMRGNVVDLAVGIVIGAAFASLVNQFVLSFIEPLVKLFTGGRAVSGTASLTDEVIVDWGAFVSSLVTFLLTALAIYFFVVVPVNRLTELRRRGKEPPPEEVSDEVRLLTEIRDSLAARPPATRPPTT